jgi:DNA anti-recombination protein RmuC
MQRKAPTDRADAI